MLDRLALAQLGELLGDEVDRDGEADAGALVGGAVRRDLIHDADDAALAVEQRATGVARVQGGVGLDRVRDREAVGRLDRAVEPRHDAGADAAIEVERIADRRDGLPDAK